MILGSRGPPTNSDFIEPSATICAVPLVSENTINMNTPNTTKSAVLIPIRSVVRYDPTMSERIKPIISAPNLLDSENFAMRRNGRYIANAPAIMYTEATTKSVSTGGDELKIY